MAADYVYRYSLRMTLARGYATPSGWATRSRVGHKIPAYLAGAPTAEKLRRYVLDYNESLLPGGANAHIGIDGRCVAAVIVDHRNGGAIVAEFGIKRATADDADRFARALRSTSDRYLAGLMSEAAWRTHMRTLWDRIVAVGLRDEVMALVAPVSGGPAALRMGAN